MNTKLITTVVIAISVTGLVIWDLVVNFNKISGDTISELTGEALKSAPILAVALGVIVGHLASNFPDMKMSLDFLAERPIIGIGVGTIIGFFFWNMGR